jgi:twitching motility protein PilI
VRGNLVPLIDLKQYLEGELALLTESSRVLLVRQLGGSVGLLVDEVLGQRNFSEEQRADAIGEEDDRYRRFVGEKYLLGEVYWGLFSMAALVRTPDFAQASA